jgi:hypothetical protein
MSAVAGVSPLVLGGVRPALAGRSFLHPLLDHLLVGGGLSLLVVLWVVASPAAANAVLQPLLPWLLVVVNGAHFASSTARLYTRPGATTRWPFLTAGLPILAFVAMLAGVMSSTVVARLLQVLYFTWSPYHYAAQTYGLAVMYGLRAGAPLGPREGTALRVACVLPFLLTFVASPGYGMLWLVPAEWITAHPARLRTLLVMQQLIVVLCWVAPAAVYASYWWRHRRPLPAITLVLMLANASWWIVLRQRDEAFAWAAVFHGLQYLVIVTVFHVRERARAKRDEPPWRSALVFYGGCVAGSYALFNCWPEAFVAAGFGLAESILVVTAVVNIHHFIVDAYIWRFRQDPNATVAAT